MLSPILFSVFVNGLAREIKGKGLGVRWGGGATQLLLYADDIVLLAETADDLQRMLDIVTEYSRKWRFGLNTKKGKSEVMVFGREGKGRAEFWLAGQKLGRTESYKYLGVEIRERLDFKRYKSKILREARKRIAMITGMGVREGVLPVRDAVSAWKALARPVVEYAAAVWGGVKWNEGEVLQREMGRRILRCSTLMTNEVILGELGWTTLKGRRDWIRLRYWKRMVMMKGRRLVRRVYEEGRKQQSEGRKSEWCDYTKNLLEELGLERAWENEEEVKGKGWEAAVSKAIFEREQKQWLERMEGKEKLRTYRTLKRKLEYEEYLNGGGGEGREALTAVRGGTNALRIETGRHRITNRHRALEVEERVCLVCASGEVEDERHFVMRCSYYADLREKMWEEVGELKGEEEEKFRRLIGDGTSFPKRIRVHAAARKFVRDALRRRRQIVTRMLDQRTRF